MVRVHRPIQVEYVCPALLLCDPGSATFIEAECVCRPLLLIARSALWIPAAADGGGQIQLSGLAGLLQQLMSSIELLFPNALHLTSLLIRGLRFEQFNGRPCALPSRWALSPPWHGASEQ